MIFRDFYETVEDKEVQIVDGEKSYYARVINKYFDYEAIAEREIERIFVNADGNLAVELKYKPVLTVKDLLSTCISNKDIKVVWSICEQYTRKARCIEVYGDRKVKSWTCEWGYIVIEIDGKIDNEL